MDNIPEKGIEKNQIEILFEQGESSFKKGETLNQKIEGIVLLLKGLGLVKNIIEGETDPIMKQTYQSMSRKSG